MKRTLYCLVPWMAMTAAAYGQTRSADVLYTYFDDSPTHGFRVSDECFVPTEDLGHWGWKVDLTKDSATITAEDKEITVGTRSISGKTCIPLRAAMTKLGASAEWIVNTDTLQILSNLTSVSVDSGRIKVTSPLAIRPKPFVLTDPSRIVIDFVGANLNSKTSQALEGGVRLTQYKPNVVRLVVQTNGLADVSKIPTDPSKTSDFELSVTAPAEEKAEEATPIKETKKDDKGVLDGTAPVATVTTIPLNLDKEDEKSTFLSMKFKGALKSQAEFRKPSPDILEVVLPGIQADLPQDFKLSTDIVTSTTVRRTPQASIVTLNLSRPLAAEVSTNGQDVSIRLLKPNVGDGRLMGKVIVVDAGHGGHDNGASSAGIHEKDFNLALAKLLSTRLTEQGATVIMTRTTDVFISLTARENLANNSHADFFISCHINDTGNTGNISGGITFHHKGNSISKVLAECIQQQIASVSGIPSLGVWSDGKIYSSGFSVLRNTKMVGVLIEFGFLNNAHDRHVIAGADFQDAVTKAVVKGLKVYLGDAKAN